MQPPWNGGPPHSPPHLPGPTPHGPHGYPGGPGGYPPQHGLVPMVARPPLPAYRLGDDVMVPKAGQFPPVCLKCGTHHNLVGRSHVVSWTPVWARVFALFALFFFTVLVILPLLLRKQTTYNIPLCRACDARWGKAKTTYGLSFLPGLAAFLGGIGVAAADAHAAISLSVIGLGFAALVGLPSYIFHTRLRPAKVWARKIDDQYVQLAGVAQTAISELAGGNAAPAPAPAYLPPHLGMS